MNKYKVGDEILIIDYEKAWIDRNFQGLSFKVLKILPDRVIINSNTLQIPKTDIYYSDKAYCMLEGIVKATTLDKVLK